MPRLPSGAQHALPAPPAPHRDRSIRAPSRARGALIALGMLAALVTFPAAALAVPSAAAPVPAPLPLPPPWNGTLTPELSAALTKRLGELRVAYGIPGLQATMIFPDGRSWRAHAGFQDYGARVPVRNATPFPVASVTKTFVAALIIELAREGRFGLDDLLVAYLPTAAVHPRVTIRQLLSHTSGIHDFFSNARIDDAILACRSCAWTRTRSLAYVKEHLFEPGTGWSYSNTNYVLLGQLAEAVTGEGYATLLRRRFFEPLHLISTFVQGREAAPYPIVHSYRFTSPARSAKPIPLWDGTGVSPFRSVATAADAAGDVASSARDLAVWARALYSGRVLGPDGTAAMLDVSGSVLLRSAVSYGLGTQQFTMDGRLAYGHNGRLLGARSAIRYLPVEQISVGVVLNTDRGDATAIVNALTAVVLPAPEPPPPSPLPGGVLAAFH